MKEINVDFILNQWIPALESGEYRQGTARLRGIDNKFCCLGVACDLLAKDGRLPDWKEGVLRFYIGDESTQLPRAAADFIGMTTDGASLDGRYLDAEGNSLMSLNDGGATFTEIAQVLRAFCATEQAVAE